MPITRFLNHCRYLPIVLWLAHRATFVWLGVAVVYATALVWPPPIGYWLILVSGVAQLATWASQLAHPDMCPRCAREMPSGIPDNLGGRILRLTLRTYHQVVVLAAAFALSWILARVVDGAAKVPYIVFGVLILSLAAHTALSHRTAKQFCPVCGARWWRGGTREPAPTPTPPGTPSPVA